MTYPLRTPHQLFIDGAWMPSSAGGTTDVFDPATEEQIDSIASANDDDIDAALRSVQDGYATWRSLDVWTRSKVLREVARLLRAWNGEAAAVMTAEQGKPLREASGEWYAAADQFDWYADEARRIYGRTVDGHSTDSRIFVRHEPIGPVAAFASWNFPALLPARKIAAALAAGCSVIVKPAEEAPRSTLLIAEACRQAGVPRGALNMLTGPSAHISERLITSGVIRKISLTGSVPVGRALLRRAAEQIMPASMELGGHAPVIVFPDADIETAAADAASAKFRNAGQVCASPSRFYVHADVSERFTSKFVEIAKSLRSGPGSDPRTDIGPLTNARRVHAAQALVEDARSCGARIAAGGGRDIRFDRGYFFEPTVLTDVPPTARIMIDEPFAPVAPIATFTDIDEVLKLANATEFGLASFVYTNHLSTAHRVSEGLDAGMVGVNTMMIALAEAPFGGVKHSGFGREGGSEGVLDYSVTKYINMRIS